MAKQRGYPDRRGMGSESDPISETFAPTEQYKAQQERMTQTLRAAGVSPKQIASMLFTPVDLSSVAKPEDEPPKEDAAQNPCPDASSAPDISKPNSRS
jgi:hypothetical protein